MIRRQPSLAAPRIHGEMLKLGFDISESPVQRYLSRKPRRTIGNAGRHFLRITLQKSSPWRALSFPRALTAIPRGGLFPSVMPPVCNSDGAARPGPHSDKQHHLFSQVQQDSGFVVEAPDAVAGRCRKRYTHPESSEPDFCRSAGNCPAPPFSQF